MKKSFLLFALCLMMGFSIFSLSGCACANAIENHRIIITSSNIRRGLVEGGGTYSTNTNVTLTATAINGNNFIAWIKNDLIVSHEEEFTFIADQQTEGKYTALFTTDNLEFFMLNEIVYDITGIATFENGFHLSNIELIDVKSGVTAGLEQDLAVLNNKVVGNVGNVSATDFQLNERIYYVNKDYYFSVTLKYNYLNDETNAISTGEIKAKFNVDFNLLSSGQVVGDTITYTEENYTLTQTFEDGYYTVEVNYTTLEIPSQWNDTSSHSFNIRFIYPFDKTV
ncbi:MAG: hypothetical protein PHX09_01335 [Clostridia bacterium]|nr:hypothetical protein [Clostridia bacterium]MDD4685985.1 hypothetical protein [Clostridia bacterium]